MHILVIPTAYPSEPRPSSGIFFKEQVEALRRTGHTVGVLVAPRIIETWHHIKQNKQLPPLMTLDDEQTYRLHRGWFPRIFPLITAFLHKQLALQAFQQYCGFHGTPDIIHAHNIFYSGYMASIIGKKHKIPTILTEHSTNFLTGRIFLPGQHAVARQTLKQIDRIIAVGKRLANKIEADYGHDITVIPNMINTDFFTLEHKPANDNFIVTCVGYLIPRKRIDHLIIAFAQAFSGDRTAQLHIGGSGSELENLQTLTKQIGVAEQVTFYGQLSREEVRDLFQQSDVVVSASHTETFGVTLIEAMSCGKPVIATRSGGPETFITDETGILIPTDDIAALSEAMITMRDNYSSYDPALIRAYCEENFSESAVLKQLNSIYTASLNPSTSIQE